MTTEIVTKSDTDNRMATAGQVANHYAAQVVFGDYRQSKASNTISRQGDDLMRFAEYLNTVRLNNGMGVHQLLADDDLCLYPESWRGVSWGLVRGFTKWLLDQGFAIGSINVRLSTVKTYCKLAMQAGVVEPTEYALIRSVTGYGFKEGKHVDEKREKTRTGTKKAEPVFITPEQAKVLKKQPNTPQGRRDAVLIRLMLDFGLRAGEVVGLRVEDVNLDASTLTFYREKIGKTQTHKMSDGLLTAMRQYLACDALASGPLLRASTQRGELTKPGLTRISVSKYIARLGKSIGIDGLSPHDLRHYWATRAVERGTPITRLQEAGGWSSIAMPARYIVAGQIANAGVEVDDD